MIADCNIEDIGYQLDLCDEKLIGKAKVVNAVVTEKEAFAFMSDLKPKKENAFLLKRKRSVYIKMNLNNFETKELTGYPSIDKPWLKYYTGQFGEDVVSGLSMYGYIHSKNKEYVDDTAMIYFRRKITYKTLFEKVNRCAQSFSALGVTTGDVVSVVSLSIPQTAYVIYALSKIGAIANLIFPTWSEDDIRRSISNTQSKVLVIIDKLYEKHKNLTVDTNVSHVITVNIVEEMDFTTRALATLKLGKILPVRDSMTWNQFLSIKAKSSITENTDEQSAAVIVYTGGTTGKSKGVLLSNKAMNVIAESYRYAGYSFVRGKTFMNILPPFIAFGLTVALHLPLSLGVAVILNVDVSPAKIAENFMKYKPNYMTAGTAQLESFISDPKIEKADLNHLDMITTGGDMLSNIQEMRVNDFLSQRGCISKLINGYGMSEVAASVCCTTPKAEKLGSVGIPLPGVVMGAFDANTNKEVGYHELGEICILSPSAMLGYFKDDEETQNIFREHSDGNHWIHTGDIGSFDENGILTLAGRIKRIIQVWTGDDYCKIYPKLLEEKISEACGIADVAVVAKPDTNSFNKLVVFVAIESNMDALGLENRLVDFAEKHLKKYEQPDRYCFLDKLPRTAIGKIDYRKLEEMADNRMENVI